MKLIDDYLNKLLNENIIFSDKHILFDYDKFLKNKNKLFIIGLSASGKTSIAKLLSKKYNIKHIEIDIFAEYLNEPIKTKVLKELSKYYNEKNWDKINDLHQKYIPILINKYPKAIFEGINLVDIDYKKIIKNNPCIVLNTSFIKSLINQLKRENIKPWNLYNIIDITILRFKYFKDFKLIESFIEYRSKIPKTNIEYIKNIKEIIS